METVDFLILGGGVTGLAAASQLHDAALVLEREETPGGLVRVDFRNGYWFDHVLHLLHFSDPEVESFVRSFLGDDLARCPPSAWVETEAGATRYPIQMHLHPLDRNTVIRCLIGLVEAREQSKSTQPRNFEQWLLLTFGSELCRIFMFPYNRKLWKRDLGQLAPNEFTWTITPPDLEAVLRGALNPCAPFNPYNANGWYPRPKPNSAVRGMELLSRGLAEQVPRISLNQEVCAIQTNERVITTRRNHDIQRFKYSERCLSTLPLPFIIDICDDAPEALKRACRTLQSNQVVTIMLSIRGSRPIDCGLWRYYADPSICFNRLIFMHEFDPQTAPEDGWGLMAEITEPSENPVPADRWITRAIADVKRVRILPENSTICDVRARVIDPAYVVFTAETQRIVEEARQYLEQRGITPLGRYGRWEYSSMARNIGDGFRWAKGQLQSRSASQMSTRPRTCLS